MERLRELGPFTLEKRRLRGISSMCTNIRRKAVKKAELDSFQQCPVTGQEVMGTNQNTAGSVSSSGKTFLLYG